MMIYAEAETLSAASCPRLPQAFSFPSPGRLQGEVVQPCTVGLGGMGCFPPGCRNGSSSAVLFLDLDTINYPRAHSLAPSSLTEAQTALRTLMWDATGFGVIIVCLFFCMLFPPDRHSYSALYILIACVSPGGNAVCA